jgi:hypothetical protein
MALLQKIFQTEFLLVMLCALRVYKPMLILYSSSVGYGLNDQGIGVCFTAGITYFSLLHSVQTGPGAHPAYLMGAGGSFPGG